MTLRQHKRRYCGRFFAGRGYVFIGDSPLRFCRHSYSRCNPVTYGG
jgi:hypothetical protein